MIRKKSRILKSALAGFLVCAVLPMTGCQKSANTTEETYNISVIIKNTSSTYWKPVEKACNDIKAEFGDSVNITYTGPDEESAEKQIALIKEAISQKADAIVLAACDPDAEKEVLTSATDAGIHIITIDSDVNYEERKSYIGTMNVNAGESAARYAAELLNNEGNIGIIYHGNATTASQRCEGFTNQLSGKVPGTPPGFAAGAGSKQNNSLKQETTKNGDSAKTEETQKSKPQSYSEIKIVKQLDGESKPDVSKEQAMKLITEENVDLIFATNSKGTAGACEAVSELIENGTIKQGEVHVIGFDYFDIDGVSADVYLNKGILNATLVQNPYNMGYLGVRYAIDLAKGEPVPSLVDTGVVLVTTDNINDDDIQFLINN